MIFEAREGSKSSEMHAFSISNSRDGFPWAQCMYIKGGASVQRYIHTLAINERFRLGSKKHVPPSLECKARMGFVQMYSISLDLLQT